MDEQVGLAHGPDQLTPESHSKHGHNRHCGGMARVIDLNADIGEGEYGAQLASA
jgi:hypothetical protein